MTSRRLPLPGLPLLMTFFVLIGVGCHDEAQLPSELATDLAPGPLASVVFTQGTVEPFGHFAGVDFTRHTGFFEGETSLGQFRVPYEIIAPEDSSLGNGTVLLEPPHWAFPPLGRDLVIGRNVIFERGMSYASVGFGTDAFNILDISATDAVIAGEAVTPSPVVAFAGVSDEEILIQFVEALTSEPFAVEILGQVNRRYAYGISQTADVLMETILTITGTASRDLFDLTVLHGSSWSVEFDGISRPPGGPLELLEGEFVPPTDVGKVLFVQAEGDLVAFDSEQYRKAADLSDYRVYEVAGGAHLPTPDNPLDHWAVTRALFVAGDRWVRSDAAPPASHLIESAPPGEIDPVYAGDVRVDSRTGIARNADLNAKGGVRMPDLAVGRAQFIASDPTTSTPGSPLLEPLTGSTIDLACMPPAGSDTEEPRYGNHGEYVRAFNRQVNELLRMGFLLEADADALREKAAASHVGRPKTCM